MSFRMTSRWLYIVALVIVGVGTIMVWSRVVEPPFPGFACSAANVFEAQLQHARQFGNWLLTEVALVALVTAIVCFAAAYLQLFHIAIPSRASAGQLALALAIGLPIAVYVVRVGIAWASAQEGSCLADAIVNAPAAGAASLTASRLPFLPWTTGLYTDAILLTFLGVGAGYAAYLSVRRYLSI